LRLNDENVAQILSLQQEIRFSCFSLRGRFKTINFIVVCNFPCHGLQISSALATQDRFHFRDSLFHSISISSFTSSCLLIFLAFHRLICSRKHRTKLNNMNESI